MNAASKRPRGAALLQAICAPHQILGQMRDGDLVQITDWIDVGAIYRA